MFVPPLLQVLVGVFDHHHRRIDHGTNGNRDATQRHDVRVHALVVHHDERGQDAQRQRDDGDERRAQVKQEGEAHHRHDEEFFQQLVREVVHGALNQARSVVSGDDFHPLGQAGLQ